MTQDQEQDKNKEQKKDLDIDFENCRGKCGYTVWCRECKLSQKERLRLQSLSVNPRDLSPGFGTGEEEDVSNDATDP